jgi:hypothetical protein
MPKKTAYLKKYFDLREGPKGLYPKPLLYKEGPEMEGFNGNFFYTFVTEPCSMHPVEGAVIHPYNEVLVFGSLDLEDMRFLHGTISIELGEEREVHTFTDPSVVCIPAGLQHGPVRVLNVDRPFVHFAIGSEGGGAYQADNIPASQLKTPVAGNKYGHLIKQLRTNFENILNDPDMDPEKLMKSMEEQGMSGTGMGYEALNDPHGIMRGASKFMGPGNAYQMVWLFGNDIENFKLNFSWGHYNTPGKWHRHGEVHVHPEEEILIFVGLDPDNPLKLGAEIEEGIGWDDERLVIRKPGLFICPKGLPHLPEITRWVDKPYGFIVACIDSGHSSPFLPTDDDGCILDSARPQE